MPGQHELSVSSRHGLETVHSKSFGIGILGHYDGTNLVPLVAIILVIQTSAIADVENRTAARTLWDVSDVYIRVTLETSHSIAYYIYT